MPSLDELRLWLQGQEVEGLPEREEPEGPALVVNAEPELVKDCPTCEGEGEVDADVCPECEGAGTVKRDRPRTPFAKRMRERAASKKRGGKYRLTEDGKDATLMFGRHKDSTLSDLSKTRDGRSYLVWLVKQDFPEELKTMAGAWHNEGNKKHEHGSMRGKKI